MHHSRVCLLVTQSALSVSVDVDYFVKCFDVTTVFGLQLLHGIVPWTSWYEAVAADSIPLSVWESQNATQIRRIA